MKSGSARAAAGPDSTASSTITVPRASTGGGLPLAPQAAQQSAPQAGRAPATVMMQDPRSHNAPRRCRRRRRMPGGIRTRPSTCRRCSRLHSSDRSWGYRRDAGSVVPTAPGFRAEGPSGRVLGRRSAVEQREGARRSMSPVVNDTTSEGGGDQIATIAMPVRQVAQAVQAAQAAASASMRSMGRRAFSRSSGRISRRGSRVAQRQVDLLERVELHVRALVARAAPSGGASMNSLSGAGLLHLVEDAALGRDDELPARCRDGVLEQRRGRADEVGRAQDGLLALGVRDAASASGWRSLSATMLALAEGLVHDAAPLPEAHLAARLLDEPAPRFLSGAKRISCRRGWRARSSRRSTTCRCSRRAPSPRPSS
jgi:hypothetical protein